MNPLTRAARASQRITTTENYLIAAAAGIILGTMLALAI